MNCKFQENRQICTVGIDSFLYRDELVVETPTLFEAEASDQEEETHKPENERFVLTDGETDDDFDDFADFDHGEGLTRNRRK